VQKIAEIEREAARGASKSYGEVLVTTQVTGFRKVRWFTHENLGYGQVDLPPTELRTTAYWLTLSEETVDGLRALGLWSSDRNNYGPNWDQMRNLARARDNYRCQICQRPEEGRAHPVHHKVPFRTFPSYVEANRLDNLITLCPECHRRVEMNVRVRSGLAGMAYALGHLAPLFVMCDDRDLGVHSDPQSPLGDGGPTIAIYDTIPAGIGLSRRLFEIHDELIERAYELVAACECQDGCPSCVGPVAESGEGGKREALALLALLANRDIPVWIESR
jgi:DEAD/DEAH box helicase domain-containing protein